MSNLIRATLTLLFVGGLSTQCFGSLAVLMQNQDSWSVVKETPDYLIVQMSEDLTVDVIGKDGASKVNVIYRSGERRVFLKGRDYKATLKSLNKYRVRQNIEVKVKEDKAPSLKEKAPLPEA